MRRLLLLSASAGAGHLRAAEAVEKAWKGKGEARHVDVLSLAPALFRRAYSRGYLDLVDRAPGMLGLLYDRTNRPPKGKAGDALRLLVDRLNTRRLEDLLEEFRPDVVCHTHFLPAEVLGRLRRKGRLDVPQAVVVTDFDVHRFWLCPGTDLYLVAREDCRIHLQALGVPPGRIRVTGIPVDPAFAEKPNLPALRRKHGVEEGLPLLLLLAGGFGVGPVEDLLKRLRRELRGARIAVIAGRNEALRERLARAAKGPGAPARVLGFTNEMHEWMALASLAVTKPGGLTTSEALSRGLPLVVVNPIPGQETRNATMLYEEGAAISGENPLTAASRVARLLSDPGRRAAMRRAAQGLGRPWAAFDAAEALRAL